MVAMICKYCGYETSTVICPNCGVNVVWYNKYGDKHDIENPGGINLFPYMKDEKEEPRIEDVLQEMFEPDGSGD